MRATLQPILLEFPESDETLSIYYALQDAGMPCTIVRHSLDPKLIKVKPNNLPIDSLVLKQHIVSIKGFIAGWVACYNREALPDDKRTLQTTPGCGSS